MYGSSEGGVAVEDTLDEVDVEVFETLVVEPVTVVVGFELVEEEDVETCAEVEVVLVTWLLGRHCE